MNAKFEKWCEDNGISIRPHGAGYKAYETDIRYLAWQAAIQSLEVTPELVLMGASSYMEDDTVPENWQPCPADIRRMRSALTAVFNAIKEQAK